MYQSELSQLLKLLFIMLTGFGVMLGIVRIARVPLILARLFIFPVLLVILWNAGRQWWTMLPLGQRALVFLVLLPVGMMVIMRLVLGKELFNHILGNFLYDVLKWILGISA